jgi:CO/xanthine dehydrogenase FAD-binding subunit
VYRASKAEQYLATNPFIEETFWSAAELAREASMPISDVRAGVEYQHEMVRNLTLQGLKEVFDELKNGQNGKNIQ